MEVFGPRVLAIICGSIATMSTDTPTSLKMAESLLKVIHAMSMQPYVAAAFAPVALKAYLLFTSVNVLSIAYRSILASPADADLYMPLVLPAIRQLSSTVIKEQQSGCGFLMKMCQGSATEIVKAEFLRLCGVVLETQDQGQQAYTDAVVRVRGLLAMTAPSFVEFVPPGMVHALVRLLNGAPPRLANNCKVILQMLEPALVDAAALTAARCEAFMPLLLQEGTPASPVECAICLASDTCQRVVLPCFHSFHAECFQQYLATGATACPYCRLSVCFSSLM